MTAFAVHFLKEISRTQLLSVAKRLIVNIDKKMLQAFDKNDFLILLGKGFCGEIVKVMKGATIPDLSRGGDILTCT